MKIDRIYKFDILLPQNINRFSGSTPRVLIVTLPDKSPGVIPLDSRTRLDEIYNSKKAFNKGSTQSGDHYRSDGSEMDTVN